MHSPSLVTLLACTATMAPSAAADRTVVVDASANWGTWEGWGTSLAWWAKAFGDRDDLANLFFTKNYQTLNGKNLPGLGFNIVRYNAGACATRTYHGDSMVVSSNIKPSRQMDGFWLDWGSRDPTSDSWDWSVDANQRAMLQMAKARGANIFELFSNSPMWWMCLNHNPSGSTIIGTDNLQSWNYESHAIYMANVAEHAKNNWGIVFDSVDPFNEPISPFWLSSGNQEGCHFAVSTQNKVLGYLQTHLDSRKLSTYVAASDENRMTFAIATWLGLSGASKDIIKRINVHGYEYGGGRRDWLYDLASDSKKKLWNSEYSEGDGSGKQLFQNLVLDFIWLHPTAWVYWQALDISGWGLIVGDNDAHTISGAATKYFVMAQFSRHVTPGMRILSTDDGSTMAAYDADAKKLVIVAANWDGAQQITYDITKYGRHGDDGATVARWSTNTGGGDEYASYNDIKISGGKFTVPFATNQVQTFEILNVA